MSLLTPNHGILRADLPVLPSPIDWSHPSSRGLVTFLTPLPGSVGSSRLIDWTNPGPNGHHGTLTDMDPAKASIATKKGWALDFDGTDYVAVPGTPALPGDVSIAFLICPDDTTTGMYVLDFSGVDEFACIKGFQPGFWNVFGGQYPIGNVAADSQIPMSGAGVWDYVIWTAEGTTLRGYVNGVEHMSGVITDGDFSPSAGMIIGARHALQSKYAGKIALVHIHDRVLLPSEIKKLHANPFGMLTRRPTQVEVSAAAVGNPWYQYANQSALVG